MGKTVTDLALLTCDALVTVYTLNKVLKNENKMVSGLSIAILMLFNLIKLGAIPDKASDVETVMLTIIPIVLLAALLCLGYHIGTPNAIVLCIMYYLYVVVIQLLSYFILCLPNNYLFHLKTNSPLFMCLVQILYMTVLVVMAYVWHDKMYKVYSKVMGYINNKAVHIVKRTKIILSIILFLALVGGGIQLFSDEGVNDEMLLLTALLIFMVLVILGLSYYESVLNTCKATETMMRARELEERNQMTSIHNEFVCSMNQFGHSYNNMMQTIDFMLNDDNLDFESIRPVLSDLVKWNEKNKINYKMRFVNIPNMIVASILSIKLGKAEELGVVLSVDYTGNHEVEVQSKDFIDILNILIDNAIEASYYSEEKQVNVSLKFDAEAFELEIVNYYKRDANGDVMKYGDSKHIGLQNIENITAVNERITMDVTVTDETFKVKLMIVNNETLEDANG